MEERQRQDEHEDGGGLLGARGLPGDPHDRHAGDGNLQSGIDNADEHEVEPPRGCRHDRGKRRIEEPRVGVDRLTDGQPCTGIDHELEVDAPPTRAARRVDEDPPRELADAEDRYERGHREPGQTEAWGESHGRRVPLGQAHGPLTCVHSAAGPTSVEYDREHP
jgi:hypothetical protein